MTRESETTPDSLERQVTDHLQSLLQEYLQMDSLADEMLDLQKQSKPIDGHMDRLRASREFIMEVENNAAGIMQQYRETRENSSRAVGQLIEQARQQIEKLMLKIASLEQSAQESYQQLMPEIDHGVRGNQMKQAYGNSPS